MTYPCPQSDDDDDPDLDADLESDPEAVVDVCWKPDETPIVVDITPKVSPKIRQTTSGLIVLELEF
jgi:hypothetical protein